MEQIISLLALAAQLELWRKIPPPQHNAGPLLGLYTSTTALMIISAVITLDNNILTAPQQELLVRLWYCGATAVYTALTVICGPRLVRHKIIIMAGCGATQLILLFTDLIVAGAQTLPSLLPTSNLIVTRIPGEYYDAWLTLICALVLAQIGLLTARIRTNGDGRDQTAAALIAIGLAATFVCTIVLAVEMKQPIPRFNAQPLIAICCLCFCGVIGFTTTSRLLPPVLARARNHDLAQLISVDNAINNPRLSNDQLSNELEQKNLLDSDTGTYVYREGQALYIGCITRFAWCKQLEQELLVRHATWPLPKIRKFT